MCRSPALQVPAMAHASRRDCPHVAGGNAGGHAAQLTHKLPRSPGGQHNLAVAQVHGLRRIADHVRHRLGRHHVCSAQPVVEGQGCDHALCLIQQVRVPAPACGVISMLLTASPLEPTAQAGQLLLTRISDPDRPRASHQQMRPLKPKSSLSAVLPLTTHSPTTAGKWSAPDGSTRPCRGNSDQPPWLPSLTQGPLSTCNNLSLPCRIENDSATSLLLTQQTHPSPAQTLKCPLAQAHLTCWDTEPHQVSPSSPLHCPPAGLQRPDVAMQHQRQHKAASQDFLPASPNMSGALSSSSVSFSVLPESLLACSSTSRGGTITTSTCPSASR